MTFDNRNRSRKTNYFIEDKDIFYILKFSVK